LWPCYAAAAVTADKEDFFAVCIAIKGDCLIYRTIILVFGANIYSINEQSVLIVGYIAVVCWRRGDGLEISHVICVFIILLLQ